MDLLLGILFNILFWPIRLLWLPYHHAREGAENSRIGVSPIEERAIAFWKKFAIIGTGLLLALVVAGLVWLGCLLWH